MKTDRHAAILEILRSRDIFTQEELTAELTSRGFAVGQATVSRDIRALNLVKEATNHRYVSLDDRSAAAPQHYRAMRDGLTRVCHAGNMLVAHTHAGMAGSVGIALDAMGLDGVLGCVAGDNCIMVVMKDAEAAEALAARLSP
jgi:transcriptional regulator of arginine metabolism